MKSIKQHHLGLLVIACTFFILGGCDNDHADEPTHDHAHPESEAEAEAHSSDHRVEEPAEIENPVHGEDALIVHLNDKASANLNLKTETIELEPWFDRIKIPGTVSVDPDRLVHVSLPATVRVLQLNAPLHSTVAAGQQLAVFELVDPELNQMQIRAVELRAELLGVQTELDRMRTYLDTLPPVTTNGKNHERRRVEADLAVADAKSNSLVSSLDAVLETLKLSGLSNGQLKSLAEEGQVTNHISIFAPHLPGSPALEVAVRSIDLGETIPAGTSLFKLVAMDRLLVIGDAFESDLPTVSRAARENLPVSLLFPAENRHVNDLNILTVESALDGLERITHFLVPVPNKLVSQKSVEGIDYWDWELRAGSRVQILVATEEVGPRYLLPSSAIIRDNGHICVFKKIHDGFERVDILMERLEGRNAVLTKDCGLQAGDQIVTNGSLQLNLILKQQTNEVSSGDGHNH